MESTQAKNESQQPLENQPKQEKTQSLLSTYKKLLSKAKKEKRTVTAEELQTLEPLLDRELGLQRPIKVSDVLYLTLNDKLKYESVYFEDERLPGGIVKIKQKCPTLKNILKQLNQVYTTELLGTANKFSGVLIKFNNSKMAVISTSWN